MQHAMAPPETYGLEGRAMYEPTYRQEQAVPQTPSRRQSSHAATQSTPRQVVGYREDYSRAQHAYLEEPLSRTSSDVSQEHLRFSEYVNRFASHDPRTTPVHSNRGVSVSERIKRFNTPSDIPPSPQNYHLNAQYRNSLEQQATRSASRYESSYRRQQDLAQDHSRSRSEEPRRRIQVNRSFNHSPSIEQQQEQSTIRRTLSREQRSQSPTARKMNGSSNDMERRSQSPVRSQTGSSLGSPSRAIEAQRAARSLLAKRRQRRQEQEAKESGAASSPARDRTNDARDSQQPKTPASDSQSPSKMKESGEREEGRTDRILREARSRSMSPRTSRYSRKSVGVRPSYTLLNGTPEKPVVATDYRSTPEKPSHATDYRAERGTRTADYPTTPTTPVANRAKGASHVAVREQEPVSPITPGSPVIPGSPVSRSPRRNTTARTSGDSTTTAETHTSSVQELKRQLWDDNEKLQVPVKPSLYSHGYSDRRTKQTTGYYSPEIQGARVRSLSPHRRQQVHSHEWPASAIGAPNSSATFNSKFLQAAMASHNEDRKLHRTKDIPRTSKTAPLTTAARHTTRENRGNQLPRRTESPRPPVPLAKAEAFRSSPVSAGDKNTESLRGTSPVPSSATHSIERVPSSAGVSTATGEPSVAKLVAKLSSVSRDDPEKALKIIDTILRAESKSSSGAPGSRSGTRAEARSPIAVPQNKEVTAADEVGDDDDDDESESSSTSCDDTSVSSITNPTYQRDDKAYDHAKVVSTSTSRNPRPSSLNKYSQPQPSASQDGSRGKSSKAKQEKKPPPPATIKVNKSDSGGSTGNRKSSSKMEKDPRGESPSRMVRALSPLNRKQPERDTMDPAAIALKIRGWDEQLNDRNLSFGAPLSPTKTEDTAATEELGSIITPQSQNQSMAESRRSHPWDDIRPQNGKKFGALDMTVATGTGFDVIGSDHIDDLGFASPWQRRRAAKRETEGSEVVDSSREKSYGTTSGVENEEKRGRRLSSRSPGESPRIAPNVYDVHRKRRSRSRDNGNHPEPSSSSQHRHLPSSTKSDTVNPFDSDYESRPSRSKSDIDGRPTSTKSEPGNPFDSSYNRLGTSNPFDSDYRKPGNAAKSDVGDIFDSAWVALPEDAFPGQASASCGRSKTDFPEAVSSAFPDNVDVFGAQVNLPSRTPSYRSPFGKEDPPESSRDPSDSGGRLRSFLKKKRSSNPMKERPLPQPNGTKPLLSAYAMDSVADIQDEFNSRRESSRSPGRRSRTLSPAPRKATKSRSPGRNRLRRRNDSFAEGEDETSSLTGSLAGSTASSVRNKNLAKKFSRFLKVYED